MERYVVGFLFNNDRSAVALIRKNRPTWQAGKLNGIGGHIERYETPLESQIRKFYKETGVMTNPEDWEYVLTMSRENDFECFVYRCFDNSKLNYIDQLMSITDEQIEICWVDNIKDAISNVNWIIGICLDTNPGDFSFYKIDGVVGILH